MDKLQQSCVNENQQKLLQYSIFQFFEAIIIFQTEANTFHGNRQPAPPHKGNKNQTLNLVTSNFDLNC